MMHHDSTSSLIQDWYLINDGRWASQLATSPVRRAQQGDAGTLAAAA